VRTVSCGLYPALREARKCSIGRIEHHHKINKGDLMPKIIVTTDPSERHDAPVKEACMSSTRQLTQRQIRCMEQLPEGHKVVNTRHGAPTVRRPNGQLLRLQRNGRLAAIIPIERVESYLHLRG
jgi:hypothetical protein